MEALAALGLAAGCASLVGRLQLGGLRLLSAALPAKAASWGGVAPTCLGAATVAASTAVHPACSACGGGLCLALRLAAAAKAASPPSRRATAWLVFFGQLALLPCVGLYSWLAGGGRQTLPWTDGRALVALLALHALLLRWHGGSEAAEGGWAPGQGGRTLVAAVLHEAAAAAGAAASLLGHPFVLIYTACASAAAQFL